MSGRKVSVATVVYFSDLSICHSLLDSLSLAASNLHEKSGGAVECYVIDNSENQAYFQSLEGLCNEFPASDYFAVNLVRAPRNLGYGGANNLVADDLCSDYHLVINPDVVVDSDALSEAVGFLDNHENVTMLSPAVVDTDGVGHVVKVYPDCFTLLLRYLGVSVLSDYFSDRMQRYQCGSLGSEPDVSVELAGGCFQFLRTELFRRIGGFDDRFFMYFEDYDLSIRVRRDGPIAYVPRVKISHAGGGVGKKSFIHHRFFIVSAIRFFSKHGWRLW